MLRNNHRTTDQYRVITLLDKFVQSPWRKHVETTTAQPTLLIQHSRKTRSFWGHEYWSDTNTTRRMSIDKQTYQRRYAFSIIGQSQFPYNRRKQWIYSTETDYCKHLYDGFKRCALPTQGCRFTFPVLSPHSAKTLSKTEWSGVVQLLTNIHRISADKSYNIFAMVPRGLCS